jgi:hypothetical protein
MIPLVEAFAGDCTEGLRRAYDSWRIIYTSVYVF